MLGHVRVLPTNLFWSMTLPFDFDLDFDLKTPSSKPLLLKMIPRAFIFWHISKTLPWL